MCLSKRVFEFDQPALLFDWEVKNMNQVFTTLLSFWPLCCDCCAMTAHSIIALLGFLKLLCAFSGSSGVPAGWEERPGEYETGPGQADQNARICPQTGEVRSAMVPSLLPRSSVPLTFCPLVVTSVIAGPSTRSSRQEVTRVPETKRQRPSPTKVNSNTALRNVSCCVPQQNTYLVCLLLHCY